MRKYAIYATAKWPGGIYATPTMAGSRSAAPIAGAWAAMMYYGHEGYVAQAKAVTDAAAKLVAGIKEHVPELRVIGEPKMSLVAFTSARRGLDIYAVYDKLAKKGWKIGAIQKPAGINLSITPFNAGTMDDLVNDLKVTVKEVLSNPREKKGGMAVLYGTAQSMPAQFVEEGAKIAIEAVLNLI